MLFSQAGHNLTIMKNFCIALFCLIISLCSASSETDFPVLYKGRFRPAEAYARLWLYDLHHAQSIKGKDSGNALDFLWKLHFSGHEQFDAIPLFWIGSAKIKSLLNIEKKQNRFSYIELAYINQIDTSNLSKKDLDEVAHLKFVLKQYEDTANLFVAIPTRRSNHEWIPLNSLNEHTKNYSAYSNEQYQHIRNNYLAWMQDPNNNSLKHQTTDSLLSAYSTIAGLVYQEAHGKALYYPTLTQLRLETWYYQFPAIWILILFYAITALLLIGSFSQPALVLLWITFILHTALLGMRCYILGRPPVSNMSETVIYVPWVAVLVSLVLNKFHKNHLILIASSAISIILLIILEITDMDNSLDQVQAVLDSQFWLMIHVLMIVGSYGIFFLGAILGHIYLFSYLYHRKETCAMKSLSQLILQSMYLGTALLIPGTILGGIWAAESWGRFWDWDPKESWAFISSCFYLICIHAYRFNKIGSFGLAIGSVTGSLAISFTWYGVNYILGTGLHSYGFGNGGEIYYYVFVVAELIIIVTSLITHQGQQSHKKFTG